jgi:hypothetical protein
MQPVQAQTQELDFTVFPLSTEMQIGKLQKFILEAPQGIYLTVGAERGFRAASMMPNITEFWLIDIADEIIKFNQINSKLLKAPQRLTYLKLRWEADFNAWQSQKLNLTQADFDWWIKHVRDLHNLDYALPEYLNKFGQSPKCEKKNNDNKKLSKLNNLDLAKIIDYKHGNYLFSDNLYARIHQLALTNKIYTAKIDLNNPTQVQELATKLNQQKSRLSILDLNNLYLSNYIGEEKYIEIIKQLLPYGQSDSILITMSNYKKLACAKFQFYLGFTFGQVKQWPNDFKMQYFIDSIPEEIVDLIEGRLYTTEDRLPTFK